MLGCVVVVVVVVIVVVVVVMFLMHILKWYDLIVIVIYETAW